MNRTEYNKTLQTIESGHETSHLTLANKFRMLVTSNNSTVPQLYYLPSIV